MRQEIFYYLKSRDFKSVEVNIDALNVLYKQIQGYTYVINIIELAKVQKNSVIETKDNGINKESYDRIISKIKDSFTQKYGNNVRILTILLCQDKEYAKTFAKDTTMFWIIDDKKCKLYIYEAQPIDFLEIRAGIEKILDRKKYVIESKIEDLREEYNVPKATVTKVTKYIGSLTFIIILSNCIIFVLFNLGMINGDNTTHIRWGALEWKAIFLQKQWWRTFTYMFLHYNFSHLFNNMIILLFLGIELENYLGKIKYMIVYMLSGILAGIISTSISMIQMENVFSCGASAAIYGIIGAIAYIVFIKKDSRIMISKNRLLLFLFLILYSGLSSNGVDNVGHIAGLIIGFISCFICSHRISGKKGNER